MRHRSRTNSRPHENAQLYAHYLDQNQSCELTPWFRRHYRDCFTAAELRDQSAERNHIFSMGSRPDLWSNLIVISGTIHRWFHDNLRDGRIVCLWRKLQKNELDLEEIRIASGWQLSGWLDAHPTTDPHLQPLHAELAAHCERTE